MKATKKQLKEIAKVEKKVAEVCDTKKTIEVTRNDDGVIINKETGEPIFEVLDIGKKRNATEVTRNDDGVIINKETGKPHFPELLKNIPNESNQLEIALSFGYKAPKISKQLKAQGFKFDKELINSAELIRKHILALGSVKILKGKEMLKAFTRLNNRIGQSIADSYCKGDEVAVLVKK
jgi:hypothetical protein